MKHVGHMIHMTWTVLMEAWHFRQTYCSFPISQRDNINSHKNQLGQQNLPQKSTRDNINSHKNQLGQHKLTPKSTWTTETPVKINSDNINSHKNLLGTTKPPSEINSDNINSHKNQLGQHKLCEKDLAGTLSLLKKNEHLTLLTFQNIFTAHNL